MSAQPVLLILGAGPNIGKHVSAAFASKSYRVAVASRKDHSIPDAFYQPLDLLTSSSIPAIFASVAEKFGSAPSVVIHNGALRVPDNADDPLASFSLQSYHDTLAVNNSSVLVALQEAVKGFRTLPDSASKTFIVTGNILNVTTAPGALTFGLGKNATAYAIRNLAEGGIYAKEGISFYYADERASAGGPVFNDIDGPAAAVEYPKLADRKDQGPWLYTFVKDKGYADFSDTPWTFGQK